MTTPSRPWLPRALPGKGTRFSLWKRDKQREALEHDSGNLQIDDAFFVKAKRLEDRFAMRAERRRRPCRKRRAVELDGDTDHLHRAAIAIIDGLQIAIGLDLEVVLDLSDMLDDIPRAVLADEDLAPLGQGLGEKQRIELGKADGAVAGAIGRRGI